MSYSTDEGCVCYMHVYVELCVIIVLHVKL